MIDKERAKNIIGMDDTRLIYHDEKQKFIMDKNFRNVKFPTSTVKNNKIHLFIDESVYFDKKYSKIVEDHSSKVVLINPLIDKKILASFREKYLTKSEIQFYFSRDKLEYYLIYISLKINGFYSMQLEQNKLYLYTNSKKYIFNLNDLNIAKIERKIVEDFKTLDVKIKII
jgi:hypothetical protein